MHELKTIYLDIYSQIEKTTKQFHSKNSFDQIFKEFVFCLCTPQSNAHRSWESTEVIFKKNLFSDQEAIAELLGKKGVRFKNAKAKRIAQAKDIFPHVLKLIMSFNGRHVELRNKVSDLVDGYGLKEASHFLRNIGMGEGICILDRHILRCLQQYKIIPEIPKVLTKKIYLDIEQKMISFSKKIQIDTVSLDFVFWYHQNGEIFK